MSRGGRGGESILQYGPKQKCILTCSRRVHADCTGPGFRWILSRRDINFCVRGIPKRKGRLVAANGGYTTFVQRFPSKRLLLHAYFRAVVTSNHCIHNLNVLYCTAVEHVRKATKAVAKLAQSKFSLQVDSPAPPSPFELPCKFGGVALC